MLRLYSLAWYLASPLVALWCVQLAIRDPAWRHGWRERLGYMGQVGSGGIWVHAASVGEVQAALRLVGALRMTYPDRPILMTTFTPAGKAHASRHLPNGVGCYLLPFDFPGATARFMRKVRPRIGIVVETEIWPNLFRACERGGVPLLVVSARVTQRAEKSYRRWRSLVARTLRVPAVISAQSEQDAERIQRLGADPTRVTVGGNLKFDFDLPPRLAERIAHVVAETGLSDRTIWIAASTHPGEEETVLKAHRKVLERHPDAILVLAPRHPGRADEVASLLQARSFNHVRRSTGTRCEDATNVFLLDSLGELPVFYGLALVAFVGGTLVPVGGHNLLEPAAFKLPLVCGEHVQNVARMHTLLTAEGALVMVHDEHELAAAIMDFLGDAPARARAGQAARRVLDQNRGALHRVMHLVAGILPD